MINNNHIPSVFKLDKSIHLDLAADACNKYFLNLVDGSNIEYANTVSRWFSRNNCTNSWS
jgi:hypothetical protein